MNRAERRRAAREAEKKPIEERYKLVPVGYVNPVTGKKFTNVNDYINDCERLIYDDLTNAFVKKSGELISELLYKAENYIAVANILIMLNAIKSVVGNLKTVQKSYQKILEAYNDASDHVDMIGIREAYNEFARDHGIEFEFADFDLNELFDDEMLKKKISLMVPHHELGGEIRSDKAV